MSISTKPDSGRDASCRVLFLAVSFWRQVENPCYKALARYAVYFFAFGSWTPSALLSLLMICPLGMAFPLSYWLITVGFSQIAAASCFWFIFFATRAWVNAFENDLETVASKIGECSQSCTGMWMHVRLKSSVDSSNFLMFNEPPKAALLFMPIFSMAINSILEIKCTCGQNLRRDSVCAVPVLSAFFTACDLLWPWIPPPGRLLSNLTTPIHKI